MQWNTLDLKGKRFGRLVALEYQGGSKWFCRCDCGGSTIAISSNLTKGNSTSCGCKTREARFKHGMAGHPLNQTWRSLRARCNNPRDPAYANYGGRGIKVCERWDDFMSFLADMGMRPPGDFELDRIDNDGPYSPDNCRWVPKKVNLRNKRTSHLVTWQGETLTVAGWAERLGIHERTLHNRLGRGWPLERAMTKAVQQRRKAP